MRAQKILVVDDEAPIRSLLQEILGAAGHEVTTAADGLAGYQCFQQHAFDVVFTDLKMPHMGGVDLFQRIKEEAPSTIVIVLTGHATLNSAVTALHSGCDDFLLKPLPTTDLVLHAVDRCLERRRALMEVASLRRISKAKGEVLEITWEEFTQRLAEMEECLDRMAELHAARDYEKATPFIDDLRASVARVQKAMHTLEQMREVLSKT